MTIYSRKRFIMAFK